MNQDTICAIATAQGGAKMCIRDRGKCSHGCTYCYMKKMCSRLNTPRLDAAELTCYLECSNFIFVGSSIDTVSYTHLDVYKRQAFGVEKGLIKLI